MRIKTVHVSRFRCIEDATLDCGPMTALVGRNGSGKSSFLQALAYFYNTSASLGLEDAYGRDPSQPVEITVVYGDLTAEELGEFQSHVHDGELAVTKRFDPSSPPAAGKYYANEMQIPQFASIRARASGMRDAYKALVEGGELPGLPSGGRSNADVLAAMDAYEDAHPDQRELVAREYQFLGPPNIGGGKLDKYTRFILVPAVRDATAEIQEGRGSVLYQLLDLVVRRRVNKRADVKALRTDFGKRVAEVFDAANLTELPDLGRQVASILADYFPGADLRFNWSDPAIPEIPLPKALVTAVEDGFEGEVSRKGHGLQRAIIVSLLQYLAQSEPEPVEVPVEDDVEGQGEPASEAGQSSGEGPEAEGAALVTATTADSTPAQGGGCSPADIEQPSGETAEAEEAEPSLIIAMEEPELYLHPNRCRYLAELFSRLTRAAGGSQGGTQIIYTTHSPHFVGLDRFDQIRIVRKVKVGNSVAASSTVRAFSLEAAASTLAKGWGRPPDAFTAGSFKAHALPIMTTMVNEGFFADCVVLVEGPGDAAILWELQDRLAQRWLELGVGVVPVDGKNNLDRALVVFQGLGLPCYLVFDGDAQNKGGKNHVSTVNTNRALLQLAGATPEDYPDTRVEETYAVFSMRIEEVIVEAMDREYFDHVRDQVCTELGHSKPSELLKNIDGAATFVRRVYASDRKLELLERIVRAITKLCDPQHPAAAPNGTVDADAASDDP